MRWAPLSHSALPTRSGLACAAAAPTPLSSPRAHTASPHVPPLRWGPCQPGPRPLLLPRCVPAARAASPGAAAPPAAGCREAPAPAQPGERPEVPHHHAAPLDGSSNTRHAGSAPNGAPDLCISPASDRGSGAALSAAAGGAACPPPLPAPRGGRSPRQEQQHAAAAPALPPPHGGLAAAPWRRRAPLPPGRMAVWWAPLDESSTCSPARTAALAACLPPDEAAEVAASSGPGVAARRTAARAMARGVLARAAAGGGGELRTQDLCFARNAHGKPQLLPPPPPARGTGAGMAVALPLPGPLRHNLTHTGDLAGVALLIELRPAGGGDSVGAAQAPGHPAASGGPPPPLSPLPPPSPSPSPSSASTCTSDGPTPRPPVLAPSPASSSPLAHLSPSSSSDSDSCASLLPPASSVSSSTFSSASCVSPPSSPSRSPSPAPTHPPPTTLAVGLDVERADRAPRDPMALARRRMAPQEVALLEALPGPAERSRMFMWLWTLKEAYVKARGTGINAPPGLKGFAMGLRPMAPHRAAALAAAHPGCRLPPGGPLQVTLTHTAPQPHQQPQQRQQQDRQQLQQQPASVECPADGAGADWEGAAPPPAPRAAPPAPGAGAGAGAGPGVMPPDCDFRFLLLAPTPAHVAAVCVARWPPAAAAGPGLGGPCTAGGAGGPRPWLGAEAEAPGLGVPLEQWWCAPLEAEGRLEAGEVVILAAS